MISSSPKKRAVSSKYLLVFAGSLFALAILLLIVRSKGGFSFDQKLTQGKRVPILFSVLDEGDTFLFSTYIELYPQEKKAALFFVNPRTSFDEDDTLLEKKDSAPNYLKSRIEDALDQTVSYRIVLTKSQFQSWIDLIGGIEVFFEPKSGHITKNYDRKKTIYVLDGRDCFDWMTFLSDTKMLSYIKRIEVQETILLTVLEKLHSSRDQISKQTIQVLFEKATTNLDLKEWEALFEFLKKERIHFGVSELPGEPIVRNKQKDEILRAKQETVRVAFLKFSGELRSSSFSEGERARIEVLNGTSKNGLARYGKILLNDKGLKVLTVDNAWDPNFKSSIILNRSGNTQYSDLISETFQGRPVYFALRKDLGLDATVILGEDFQNSKD
ncbi:MAG: LytR C-terminal domain-containing protein [Leptospira sp.]|nr:LytR C-terminal domain-containing protein [Leptospira sp.]